MKNYNESIFQAFVLVLKSERCKDVSTTENDIFL